MAVKKVVRKRKELKKVDKGQVHIQSSFNNTIVSVTDMNGNAISQSSAGALGYRGSRKSTPFAAQQAAEVAIKAAMEHGLRSVEVYVKELDAEKKKISLGYKKDEENPWTIFQNNYNVDDVVKVTIVSMTTYGAFARIIPGIDGLIHISQIANKRINKPADELTIGQEVEAKITAVDLEKKRISLSIRALLPVEEVAAPAEEVVAEEAPAEEAAPAEVVEEAAE